MKPSPAARAASIVAKIQLLLRQISSQPCRLHQRSRSVPCSPAAFAFILGAAVAFDTVVDVANAFFVVFCSYVRRRVFVTAIAGEALEVVTEMAGDTFGVMVTVENKIFVVIKTRGLPALVLVTVLAVAGDLVV